MPAELQAALLELRRQRSYCGPRNLVLQLAKKGVEPLPSESAVYRCLVRAGAVEQARRHPRRDTWKRWERGRPMELWQVVRRYGVPAQVLTDNGKVFTGRYAQPPVEVLFDRIGRENGIEHLLTQPRMPTTTGKVERFHRTLRLEFDTAKVFRNLQLAQSALDEWVTYYNTERTHQSLGDVVRLTSVGSAKSGPVRLCLSRPR